MKLFKRNSLISTERSAIAKKSMTYIVSDIINKILPFLLLPIVTRYLMPSDYGILSVFEAVVAFLAVFVGLGSQEMVKVNYFKLQKSELQLYIGNVFIITILTSVIYLIVLFALKEIFLKEYGLGFVWLFIAILLTFGNFFAKIISIIWIAEGNSFVFAKYQNFSSLFIVATTVFFVVVLELNWQGRVYSLLSSSIIFSISAFYFILKKGFIKINLNFNDLWSAIKESFAVLPYSISFWFKNSALLLLMAAVIGQSETGLYASAFKIAVIVNFATVSINKVWQPLLFRLLASKIGNNDLKIVKRIYLYMGIIILVGIFILLFSDLIVKLALAPAYYSASIYVRYLVIAITLQSLFTAMADFLMFHKATRKLSIVSINGVVIQYLLILIFFYFKETNVMNILYSIIIAAVYTFIHSWILANKVKPLPWLYFIR